MTVTVGAESADPDVPRLTAGSTERLQGRLVRGVLWNIVGTVFNQGSTFVVDLILANLWGLKTFGEYAMVQSTVAVVASMAQFATGYTATKYITRVWLPLTLTGRAACWRCVVWWLSPSSDLS